MSLRLLIGWLKAYKERLFIGLLFLINVSIPCYFASFHTALWIGLALAVFLYFAEERDKKEAHL